MNILAIETSTAHCSVSIQGKDINYHEDRAAPQKHAELILPMIEKAMQETGVNSSQLDLLAFGEGPGAFTGLRIAAGVIQGLALGWDKPVVAISSLEALAYQGFKHLGKQAWLACLDARMGEVYTQFCEFSQQGDLLNSSTASLVKADSLSTLSFKNGIGDIEASYPEQIQKFETWLTAVPVAFAIAELAAQKAASAADLSQQVPQPVYLRASVS
ncbi:tRNA (adenosine(37)-N6)-threonylcarbamoyltransferase complex dimerization subunit type 1 TsaB [Thiomicrospira microaerophila]|uniref:tRNA (adenosine(37)-N6)-threonylcarbamoyltransferase complex dimerization subunit type 1 TsaB n=1 Tax=Thiomicrospira microaerophila TaxID=406020 RepID=UPI00200BDDC5|nr:tRNA (adenosine(37)-N6)-threonylcarbamoyltransferase complex dimerization subunit type 1 TsaB [Thiomicrospira microaerophila]UQB41267.1 tRNA (adenosine(37)-N6)-threonylcarbamoyltransferase complex dimerization subunit type 1 TsaB [Thiomicrospira microaerophila]